MEEEGTWENIEQDRSVLFGQMAARKTQDRRQYIGEDWARKRAEASLKNRV